ncbi:MAG: response regulator transcription factor [Colwellia sp.]|uniref:LytR/AlgR family response regulator transcription factor n=1 Tax=Colwellia sp. TaxID=56799 RepID=UPI0025C65992|nr:LytTR family DNA-binding domain-containing protein [Colwellia sp.]NQZ27170.1 response regulator transcription factor [Colwellia sp.]
MVNIVIAEDEEILRLNLERKLQSHWPQGNIIASVKCGKDALSSIDTLKPDVVFLDIQMGDLTGIEVIQQSKHNCHVVFITAYDKYAIEAFEAGAIDYLLKPYSDKRLKDCIDRLNVRLASTPIDIKQLLGNISSSNDRYLKWLKIQIGSKFWLLDIKDIICFKACGRYVKVLTKDREALVRMPLKSLSLQLDPDVFWQVHRSTILSIEHLDYVQTSDAEQMHAHMKKLVEPLAVSRSFAHLFRNLTVE